MLKAVSPQRIQATELAGEKIKTKIVTAPGNNLSIGGMKVIAKSGWFAARPSGTEDVYKIYAESFRNKDHLQQIELDTQSMVDDVIGKS